jgi:hypothetical protein
MGDLEFFSFSGKIRSDQGIDYRRGQVRVRYEVEESQAPRKHHTVKLRRRSGVLVTIQIVRMAGILRYRWRLSTFLKGNLS